VSGALAVFLSPLRSAALAAILFALLAAMAGLSGLQAAFFAAPVAIMVYLAFRTCGLGNVRKRQTAQQLMECERHAPVLECQSFRYGISGDLFDPADAPRFLLANPWTGGDPSLTLDERVRIAIEASLRASRTLGVICFEVPAFANQPEHEVVLRMLRERLRRSDHVEIAERRGGAAIHVYVPLLRHRSDLAAISERLLETLGVCAGAGLRAQQRKLGLARMGLAMYPIDGYTRADLLASARANMRGGDFCITGSTVLRLKDASAAR